MPYQLANRGDETCVMKRLPDGSLETVKCHPSREKAVAHLRALWANVEDAKDQEVAVATELKRGIGLLAFVKRKLRREAAGKERHLALDKDI